MEKKTALVFSCGNRYFGIESSMVIEVMFQHYVVKQSHLKVPFFAMGKIHGAQVPIICSGQRLGLNKGAKTCLGNVILMKIKGDLKHQLVGVMVESVEGSVHYSDYELIPRKEISGRSSTQGMVVGTIDCDGMEIQLIDMDSFLNIGAIVQNDLHEASCVA